jgi:hypothetical protein
MFAVLALAMLWSPLAQVGAQGTPIPPTRSTTPVVFSVTGRVSSGTAGLGLPAALTLTLNLVTTEATGRVNVRQQTTPLGADGLFRFDGVSAVPGTSAFVTTSHEGVTQGSLIAEVVEGQATLDLPVTLYARTADPGGVRVARAQFILDFQPGGVMQVLATYLFSTSGDRFYSSIAIPLPIGARSIAFINNLNNRFSVGGAPAAPVIQDSRPVLPGQAHEIVFSYQLPYDKGAPIDQDYPFGTQMVEVLIPDDARVTLTGDFAPLPNITINPQRPYTQYNLRQPLAAGSRLIFTLDGVPPAQLVTLVPALPGVAAAEGNQFNFLPLALCTAGLVAGSILGLGYLFRPKRPPQPS